MIPYVLIIRVTTLNGVGVAMQEFHTKESCVAALEAAQAQDGFGRRVWGACVRM